MTTITRERLLKIQQWRETYGTGSNVMLPAEEAEELARIALVSLTAEPVAWTDEEELRDLRKVGFCEMFSVEPISKDADMLRVIPLYRHAQPTPVVPEEMPKGLADQIVSLLAHNIGDKLLAQKIWNACRAVMLQSKYRDLSQPVDPQISEYEKIMGQAGMRQEPVAFLNCSGTVMTVGSYGFNVEPGKFLPLYAAPYIETVRGNVSQQDVRENKGVNYPVHIASKLERLGGMFSLELLLTDFADELVKDGNKFEASILRNAAECINKINQEGRNDNKQNTE